MNEQSKRFIDVLVDRYEETENPIYAETLVLFYSVIGGYATDGIKQYCMDKLQTCPDTYVQSFLRALNEK